MKVSIYKAQSYSQGEEHSFTCGWTRWGNLKKAMYRKHARLISNSIWFEVENNAQAIAIEKACHRKATRMFGRLSNVRFSTANTGDSKNSRTNEWWFDATKTRFVKAMETEADKQILEHLQYELPINGGK